MHTKPIELGDNATLFEISERIYKDIKWINWEETMNTYYLIENDPTQLISCRFKKIPEYGIKVDHNLPEPEFDDTGYIGRRQEMVEINELLLNKKNQIISIIGTGGIGKTAITIKLLYDLIDNCNHEFDAILWISLKTRTLSNGEFVTLNNTIKEFDKIIEELTRVSILEESLTPEENIIKFMTEFNTLLVLDNLETINTEKVNQFLKQIPFGSKVLITSRYGLGELEYRYKLEGMNSNDAMRYFRELSKYYGLEQHRKSDIRIKNIVEEHLYNNPLSIKWYMSGMYNGISEEQMLCNKEKLIEFCMSNAYSNISSVAKDILSLLLLEDLGLCLGEIDYFLNYSENEIKQSINELLKTNMIKIIDGEYEMIAMARDYLSLYHKPNSKFVENYFKMRRQLNNDIQNIRIRKENDPYNPTSLFSRNSKNEKLACYYLSEALEYSYNRDWKKSNNILDKAERIAPDYFEVYKIKAFILAQTRDMYGAISNYNIAISKSRNDFEKSTVLYLFAKFYQIYVDDCEKALEMILRADECSSTEYIMIKLEKARILMYLGKYGESELVLNELNIEDDFADKELNIYVTIFAELYRRKADILETRDLHRKIELLRIGLLKFEILVNIDSKSYEEMIRIISDLSYMCYSEDCMKLIDATLKKYHRGLNFLKNAELIKIKQRLKDNKGQIRKIVFDSIMGNMYDPETVSKSITKENEGVVLLKTKYYGFIGNSINEKIYFSVNDAVDNVSIGDTVKFSIYYNEKGIAARYVEKLI